MTRIAALVPMRHNSVRVKEKNYRPFAGVPLCHHILRTLLDCSSITEVVVDTDSAPIMEDMARSFPRVRVIERPPHLRDGETPMNEVLLNTTAQVDADFYLQTHSTNPLLKPATIEAALVQFLTQYPACDSMFSVTRLQTRLWDQLGRPVNHNPHILLRTQDLPPIYLENSNFYVFERDALVRRRNRIGERPLMFEIDRIEAWDIDEELDFTVGEFLYYKRLEDKPASLQ